MSAKTYADQEADAQMRIEEHAERTWLAARELERVTFIRSAAIALYTVYEQDSENRMPGPVYNEAACWKNAQALWDAKPEDC